MRVFLAEKPSLAQIIVKGLGGVANKSGGYLTTAKKKKSLSGKSPKRSAA